MIDQITMLEIWREHAATLEAATLEKQRDELLAALKDCVDLLDGYFKEVGGCDHSVGICMCSDFAVNARAKEVIAKVGADK